MCENCTQMNKKLLIILLTVALSSFGCGREDKKYPDHELYTFEEYISKDHAVNVSYPKGMMIVQWGVSNIFISPNSSQEIYLINNKGDQTNRVYITNGN